MSLVASVVASLLFGIVGGSATTSVLLYSDAPLNVTVQNNSYTLGARELLAVPVTLPVEKGNHTYLVTVTSDSVSYEFPVSVEGRREWSWWYVAPMPLFVAMLVWLFRRQKVVGTS